MSKQESRTGHARGARRLALVVLLGSTGLGFSHPAPGLPAAACSGSVVRNVVMSGGRADFGEDPHLLGSPKSSGRICWGGGAIVEGRLYWDAFEAGCAHIVIRFLNSTSPRQQITFYSNGVCSPGGLRQDLVYSQVNGSTTNPAQRVGRIEIELFTSATSTGPRTRVTSMFRQF